MKQESNTVENIFDDWEESKDNSELVANIWSIFFIGWTLAIIITLFINRDHVTFNFPLILNP